MESGERVRKRKEVDPGGPVTEGFLGGSTEAEQADILTEANTIEPGFAELLQSAPHGGPAWTSL